MVTPMNDNLITGSFIKGDIKRYCYHCGLELMRSDVVQEFKTLYVCQGGGKVTRVSLGKHDVQHLHKSSA